MIYVIDRLKKKKQSISSSQVKLLYRTKKNIGGQRSHKRVKWEDYRTVNFRHNLIKISMFPKGFCKLF